MSFLKKLVSGITAAPRALGSLVTGNIKDFKLIDSKQSVGKSLTQGYIGTLTAGATAGAGLLAGAAAPLVSKLVKSSPAVSNLKEKSGLVGSLINNAQKLVPGVIKSGLNSFDKPLTGLQREVFGNPPSNSVEIPKKVSYQSAGLDNFNASSGDISISTEKKMPAWLWPAVSLGLAVITILISIFSKKRR